MSLAAGGATALLVTLAAGPAPAADLSEARARGTLRVLAVSPTPLTQFFALEKGGEPGFDREMLELFAKLHHLTLEPVAVPSWERLVPSLLEGKGDCIAGGISRTPERSRLIGFTEVVFPSRHVVLTRKPTPPVLSADELPRRKWGVLKGTSAREILAEAKVPPDRIVELPAGMDMQTALRTGYVTAYVMGVERALLSQRRDPALEIGMPLGRRDDLAWGVRKEDAELRAALNDFITNFRRTPSWNRLVVKYFGEAALAILQTAGPE